MPKVSTRTSSRGRAACLSVTFAISAGLLGLSPSSLAQQEPKHFGPDDVETLIKAFDANRARFDRDFKGRAFQATLPLESISDTPFSRGEYRVDFGLDPTLSDNVRCEVVGLKDRSVIEILANLNRGQMAKVSGKIRTLELKGKGRANIKLDDCEFVPLPE